MFVKELLTRAINHDNSKFGPEEFPIYASAIDEFEKHPFGTPGYQKAKDSIAIAVKHHYKCNSHHPEYYANEIDGMNLVDLIEMVCDWKAANQNHKDNPGNMQQSLEFAINKYKISPQLAKIIQNTIEHYKL